jgi:hypothetical protein
VKINVCPDSTGLAYRIINGRREWKPEPIQMTTDDGLAAELEPDGGDLTEGEQAAEWLHDLLSAGPLPEQQVQEQGRQCRLLFATIRRAKKMAGIEVVNSGFEKGSKWLWKLRSPSTMLAKPEDAQTQDVSTFEESERLHAGIVLITALHKRPEPAGVHRDREQPNPSAEILVNCRGLNDGIVGNVVANFATKTMVEPPCVGLPSNQSKRASTVDLSANLSSSGLVPDPVRRRLRGNARDDLAFARQGGRPQPHKAG